MRMATPVASTRSYEEDLDILMNFGSDECFDEEMINFALNNTKNLTIEERFKDLSIFKQPLQIIGSDESNKLVINNQAMAQICSVDAPLNIVAITGLYRSGKSYLMNILAGQKTGFLVGSRVASQTKGIWGWCRPHPKNSDEVLLLLDTEGLSDPEKGDADHDNKLFCLTILLSSTMIYNNQGVFNHDSLQKLSFVTELTKSIRFGTDKDVSDGDNDENLCILTPTFIMCLRDFFLDMEDENTKFENADQFFQSRLDIKDQPSQQAMNEIRKSIIKYFPKRKCFALSQPAMNKQLTKLETLKDEQLAQDFRDDIEKLKEFVYDKGSKVLDAVTRKRADGLAFESFARSYVKSLNESGAMTYSAAYERASMFHNSKLVLTLVHEYRSEVETIVLPVGKKEALQKVCIKIQRTKIKQLTKQAYPYQLGLFLEKAMGMMHDVQKEKIKQNVEKVQEMLAKMLTTLHDSIVKENMTRGKYDTNAGLTLFKQDIEDIKLKFFRKAEDVDIDERETAFLSYKKSIKDERLKVEMTAKMIEDQERNEKLQKDVQEKLQKDLNKHLADMRKKNQLRMEREMEKMKQNYMEAIGLKAIKSKGFWQRLKLLFTG